MEGSEKCVSKSECSYAFCVLILFCISGLSNYALKITWLCSRSYIARTEELWLLPCPGDRWGFRLQGLVGPLTHSFLLSHFSMLHFLKLCLPACFSFYSVEHLCTCVLSYVRKKKKIILRCKYGGSGSCFRNVMLIFLIEVNTPLSFADKMPRVW